MTYSNDNTESKKSSKTQKAKKVVDINIHKYNFKEFEKEHLPFTMICNKVIQDCSNPFAGFIWIYLQSKPEAWKPCKWEIMKRFDISEATYKRHMRYLSACNLIEYHPARGEDGKLTEFRLVVLNGSKFDSNADNYRGIVFDTEDTCSRGSVDNFLVADPKNHGIKNDTVDEPALTLASHHGIKNDTVDEDHGIKKPYNGEMTPHINTRSTSLEKKEKETPISPKGDPKKKTAFFSFEEMLEDNPFNIHPQLLRDWMAIRKSKRAPITPTAWKNSLSVMKGLQDAGLCPQDCFEQMVANGWQGMQLRYWEKEIQEKKKPALKYPTPEERAANEQKIREREIKAQEEKRKEIESAKSIGDLLSLRPITIDLKKIKMEQDNERTKLGMSPKEYHKHLLSISENKICNKITQ
jgi:hypothetical protein